METTYRGILATHKKETANKLAAIRRDKPMFQLFDRLNKMFPSGDEKRPTFSIYHSQYTTIISTNLTGFSQALPFLEFIEDAGFPCVKTHDYPGSYERNYCCREIGADDKDQSNVMEFVLCVNLREEANGTCKRVIKSRKRREVIDYEYEFICSDEEKHDGA